MFKELFESNKSVYGTSPAGSWVAVLNRDGRVIGGADPYNSKMTDKWLWGLADSKHKKEFKKAILSGDAKEASKYSQVTVTKIEG